VSAISEIEHLARAIAASRAACTGHRRRLRREGRCTEADSGDDVTPPVGLCRLDERLTEEDYCHGCRVAIAVIPLLRAEKATTRRLLAKLDRRCR
jgi:hypothetical protein